jgi:ATP-dependent DNA helicase RecQ
MIAESKPMKHSSASYGKLDALVSLGGGGRLPSRAAAILTSANQSTACSNCDNCLNPPRVRDGTAAAQKALSCVYRTGQRFGAGHLIDVLRGNSTERVQRFGHDELKTFNVGADLTAKQWRAVFRQLIALGCLEADAAAFGAFKLTDTARGVLKGEVRVSLRESQRPRKRDRGQKAAFVRSFTAQSNLYSMPCVNGAAHGARTRRSRLRDIHDSTLEASLPPSRARSTITRHYRDRRQKAGTYGEALLTITRN